MVLRTHGHPIEVPNDAYSIHHTFYTFYYTHSFRLPSWRFWRHSKVTNFIYYGFDECDSTVPGPVDHTRSARYQMLAIKRSQRIKETNNKQN